MGLGPQVWFPGTTRTWKNSPFHTHKASLALSVKTHEEHISGNILVLGGRGGGQADLS